MLNQPLARQHLSRVRPIPLRDLPLLCLAKLYGLFGVSPMESMFQLLTKICLSLLYRRPFPVRIYESIAMSRILSRGLSQITETVIVHVMLPRQLQDGVH